MSGYLEDEAELDFSMVKGGEHGQDDWLPNHSSLQANFEKIMRGMLYWFQKDCYVLVLQAVEHHGAEYGGVEAVYPFKLWYKASALPLPTQFCKKFEFLMGRFL